MKKTIQLFTGLFFISLLLLLFATSCKKNINQLSLTGPVEKLVSGYIKANPSVIIKVDTIKEIPYELGFVFQSSRKGFISGLGIRMPVAGSIYTVSLWDYDTRQLLRQYQLLDSFTNRFTFIDMEVLNETVAIPAGKKYVASIFTKATGQSEWSYYYMLQPGKAGAAISFIPFTQGSLTCVAIQSALSFTPVFPDQTSLHTDILNGFCDVAFRSDRSK